jgi:hypothetical protein
VRYLTTYAEPGGGLVHVFAGPPWSRAIRDAVRAGWSGGTLEYRREEIDHVRAPQGRR